jgi:RNA polymerase sigma-70 factor (ECF subfamily)
LTEDASEEERLVVAARGGDRAALAALLDKSEGAARGLVLQMLGARADVDDLLQEARLRAVRSIAGFELRSAFQTWFCRIALNLAVSELRRRRKAEAAPLAGAGESGEVSREDPSRDAERRELRERLAAAVDRLPAGLRQAFDLVHREGLAPAAAAERLGLPAPTLRTRLFHARRRLREALDDLVSG